MFVEDQLAGCNIDLSNDAEIAFAGKALHLNGQHTFDINDDQAFVACVGEGCDSCFIKNKRANMARHAENALIKRATISGTEKEKIKTKRCDLPRITRFHFAISTETSKRSVC